MKAFYIGIILGLASYFCQAQTATQYHPVAPSVPDFIEFAGKKIRFDRDDLYERMDRELIAFTYMHSTSVLMLKRAERIFAQVEPVLKAQGIPDDLKYLMVIESNLDPKALSRAGAAGLWQMMKATGQRYGLEVNNVVDERYNIRKETVAACKYLREAYAKYGDWMTVAASYNAGQAGISRQLKLQRQKSAMDLLLVEETSRYMFRILAAKYFMENPLLFGFSVEEKQKYPYRKPRKIVETDKPIESLVDFAEKNGTSYARLKEANLWLRDTLLTNKSGKKYEIIIP